jgi:alpha 1,2-mannosyltransferase
MCHFFANDIFLRPELEGYRYYMRMDDDSYILSPLRENVFAVMSTHAYRYAYRVIVKDKPQYCRGLWARAEAYFTESSSAIRPFSEVTPCGAFYTNFEICDLAWFQSEPWQGFFRVIDEAGGIWRHRWGDHVIRFIGVKALVPDSQLRCVVQMHYRHQSEWRSGYKRRLPHDMLRYYAWLSWMLVRAWLARRT